MIDRDDRFDDVLVAARDGTDWALVRLYRDLYPRVLRYAAAVEPTDAEDIAGDTWLDVVRGLERFRGDERAFRAWAFTIARRRVLDVRRRRARRRTEPTDPTDLAQIGGLGDVEHEALTAIGTSRAVELITSTLTPDQADVVLLRLLGDLRAADVAEILGKRPEAVRVLQHRALRRLAAALQAEGVTR